VTFICKSSSILNNNSLRYYSSILLLYILITKLTTYIKKKIKREREKQAFNPIKVYDEINYVIMRNSL